jgi:hypothetical protein
MRGNRWHTTDVAGVSDLSGSTLVGELERPGRTLQTSAGPDRTTFYRKEVGCA